MSASVPGAFSRLAFADRIDECRLVCHPDIEKLCGRDDDEDEKACCVVVAKQQGAGKTYFGQECLKVALENCPAEYDRKVWEAKLPVCTLYCAAQQKETFADMLMRVAHCATRRIDQLEADWKESENSNRGELVRCKGNAVTEEDKPLEDGEVGKLVNSLNMESGSLELSPTTTLKHFKIIAAQLEDELEQQPLSRWAEIVGRIVTFPADANKICTWLGRKVAISHLIKACERWNKLYSRRAALMIVIDEAQWVLPGKDLDDIFNQLEGNRREIEEIQKQKAGSSRGQEVKTAKNMLRSLQEARAALTMRIKSSQDDLRKMFEMMQPVFCKARLLWTGVSSAAVHLQMSDGDRGSSFRVISVALPPLDVAQWAEALERTPSSLGAQNLMEEMIEKLEEKPPIKEEWGKIDGHEDFKREEKKRRALLGMMSCTGGWPYEVARFVRMPNRAERNWLVEVFGSGERQQRMGDATTQLLDQVYLEPNTSVLDLMEAIDPVEPGRVLYELLHTSGLRLVKNPEGTPVIYVPESNPRTLGVATINNLDGAWLRHTTGSLLLQARLRKQTENVYAPRGKWEAFIHDVAEEATVNTLSHLDALPNAKLKDVFPWLTSAPLHIANKLLKSDGLCAFRGLVVSSGGKLSRSNVPRELKDHRHVKEQIEPGKFQRWLAKRCVGGDKNFVPFLYVFGPQSTSGDILLVLRGLHIHMQIKNAAKDDLQKELIKFRAVACKEVANVFVLINYYDHDKKMPRPFVEMSTLRMAAIKGVTREAGTDDPEREIELTGIEGQCLVANLENMWPERVKENLKARIERTPASMSDKPEAAESDIESKSEDVEEQPMKKLRITHDLCWKPGMEWNDLWERRLEKHLAEEMQKLRTKFP